MGTAGAPKRENHVKGQACLVYKRNSLPLEIRQYETDTHSGSTAYCRISQLQFYRANYRDT